MVDMTTSVGALSLANPVLLASGCAGYGGELDGLVDLDRLGGMVTKGVSSEPWDGNPPPRIAEVAGGMLNAIGLQNGGLRRFLEVEAPSLAGRRCAVLVNVIGRTSAEYAEVAAAVGALPSVDALELNISCPNIRAGGVQFGTRPGAAAEVTRAVVAASPLPVWVKLSPAAADIGEVARAVEEAGAAALTVSNTVPALAVDLDRRRPRLGNVVGGLSGPAIKPVVQRLVWECVRAVSIPVVGCGGVSSGRDALEYLVLGARAVQVGTATLVEPSAGRRIVVEMERYLEEQGLASVEEIIGTFRADPR